MNTEYLKTFLTLAELRNFTKTAQQHHIVQSTVTLRIRELERELGKHLLQHDKKNVVLTDAGRQLLPYARKMVELENDAKDDLNTLVNFPAILHIGAVHTVYDCHLQPILMRYICEYPSVALKVSLGDSKKVIQQLFEDAVDLAISYSFFENNQISCMPFRSDRMLLVTNFDNHEYEDGIEIHTLRRVPLLFSGYSLDNAPEWFNSLLPECCGFQLSTNVGSKLIPFIEAGNGYAFLPEGIVAGRIDAKILREIPLLNSELPDLQSYITVKRKNLRKKEICDWLSISLLDEYKVGFSL